MIDMIPEPTRAALDRYVDHQILPGGFLMSVLSNNLFSAVARADNENLEALPELVRYIYNHCPSACWGSEGKVYEWVKERFYANLQDQIDLEQERLQKLPPHTD
jgi:hypothetical protein